MKEVKKMKVIVAPEIYEQKPDEISLFLAGGITGCMGWQDKVIEKLGKYSLDRLVVYNPRRDNFPIGDPDAAPAQVKWEFDYLQRMDIFSMFFCNGESDQPICMYELGRNIMTMHIRFPEDWESRIVISCCIDYKRSQDVDLQTKLAFNKEHPVVFGSDSYALMDNHVDGIVNAYRLIIGEN